MLNKRDYGNQRSNDRKFIQGLLMLNKRDYGNQRSNDHDTVQSRFDRAMASTWHRCNLPR